MRPTNSESLSDGRINIRFELFGAIARWPSSESRSESSSEPALNSSSSDVVEVLSVKLSLSLYEPDSSPNTQSRSLS